MKCTRCSNEDPRFFGWQNGIPYCRRCVAFSRLDLGQRDPVPELKKPDWNGEIRLEFSLTPFQKEISGQILSCLKNGQSVFCHAAAGAGKTEITFESIDWFLKQKRKVCFAISRRQVVLEIAARLQNAFPGLQVTPVCEGYTEITDGDLIVCTTHQLWRWPSCFDLLILDELDAFPYRGNRLLEELAARSCKGVKLFLSATPDEAFREDMEAGRLQAVRLFRRPHGKPLPEPRFCLWPKPVQLLLLLHHLRRLSPARVLVFVPRIRDGKLLSRILGCPCIDSTTKDKDALMDRFRAGKFRVLVSTTLLERGITVPSVQVMVLFGDHPVFTCASLIQIFGRAGRSFRDPEGECLCFAGSMSESMKECADILRQMNDSAFSA